MSKDKKETWVTDNKGRIVGKDTTEDTGGGSSKTTHQEVLHGPLGVRPTKITGVTYNQPDGKSKTYKK